MCHIRRIATTMPDDLYTLYRQIKNAPYLVNDDEIVSKIEAAYPNFPMAHSLERHWAVPAMNGKVNLQGGGSLQVRVGPLSAPATKSEFAYPFGATGLRLGLPKAGSGAATK